MRRLAGLITIFAAVLTASVLAQKPGPTPQVRTVTIPISIFTKRELKENQAEEIVQADRLTVKEDKDEQQILSIKSVSETPLSIALLIQEDLTGNFNLQLDDIRAFIRRLPRGTRVMVAYSRSGSIEMRQRFTTDLERAAKSLRIVSGNASFAPRSPFDSVADILSRFDGVPAGRRAILLFSDGLDTTDGTSPASVAQSVDLDRAMLKAQRKGVAVYSFYSPTAATDGNNLSLGLAAQGALQRLSDESGGRSFYNGSIAPVSFDPFFRELVLSLNRQFSLTYLSTHMKKGYHKVVVESTNPEVQIVHPTGYYYR